MVVFAPRYCTGKIIMKLLPGYYASSLLFLFLLLILLQTSISAEDIELFRIRILNRAGGPVEVSSDKGVSFTRVGMVTDAAITTVEGFLAAKYAASGTIAAIAVHGLRIKTGGMMSDARNENRIISILPVEFHAEPAKFGGHIAGNSGIMTNIPAGTSIFRNLSPLTGNQVYLQKSGSLINLPYNYHPQINDRILIIVAHLNRIPNEIIFENRKDGIVEARYDNRKEIIAIVRHPVTGIGRFDATGYTGVGAINTNHPGVITISTSPLNGGEFGPSKQETRGGFQIVPATHALSLDISPQYMVIAPLDRQTELEGTAPLFNGCIGLASDIANEKSRYYADMRSEKSDWSSLPAIVGKNDYALSQGKGNIRHMAYLRLSFPSHQEGWVKMQIQESAKEYLNNSRVIAIKDRYIIDSDLISLSMNKISKNRVEYVNLYMDGEFRGVSNQPPYSFVFKTSDFPKGEHHMEMNAIDYSGKIIASETSMIYIKQVNERKR